MAATRRTVVFAKRPEAGRVKTRLAPVLGPERAAELAAAMLADLVDRLASRDDLAPGIAYAPEGAEPWFRERFPDAALYAQEGDGLAARMQCFFEQRASAAPDETVVILGADAPLASLDAIAAAHAELEGGVDVVLGPDEGGGYWILGLRGPAPEVFDVTMSTRGMCAETVDAVRAAGRRVALVARGFDVDVPDDLRRLRDEIAALDRRAPGYPRRTADFLAQHPTT